MGKSFEWTALAGTWATASNWFDLTTGTPAVVAPTSGDSAMIIGPSVGAIAVEGPASALDLTLEGGVTLAGNFNVGTLALANPPFSLGPLPVPATSTLALVGTLAAASVMIGALHLDPANPDSQVVDTGTVDIGSGAMMLADTITLTAGAMRLNGGTATVSGDFIIGERQYVFDPLTVHESNGALEINDHAVVHLGSLTIVEGSVSLDSTSILEIGSAGTAAAGTITIDPDGTLFAAPSFLGPAFISGPMLNNGTVSSWLELTDVVNNGTLNSFGALGNVANNGTIASSGYVTSISGGGVIEVWGDLSLGPNVANTVSFGRPDPGSLTIRFPSSFTAPISGLSSGDEINFATIAANKAVYTATGPSTGVLSLRNANVPVVSLTLLGNYTGSQFAVSYDGFGSTVTLACFAAGTRIATHRGLVAVEALHQGDLIYTAQEEDFRPVVWIGHREVDCASHPEPWKVWPVRIQAGGFGPGMPLRDLYLSPDHAVFASGVLIPIKHLINGTSIAQIAVDRVTYYHVELERHGVLMAEGLPTESLLKGGDRSNFSNSDGPVRLFADFSGAAAAVLDWEAFGCAPLLIAGPEVDAVRHHLAVRMTKSPTLRRRSHRRKPGVAA